MATPGMPERKAVARRQARVREMMHTLPPAAQAAIMDDLEGTHKYPVHDYEEPTARHGRAGDDDPTGVIEVPSQH
jgi:phospholipid/cholesterol/gamma-HCH transport system ATP-binding protein